MKEYVIQSGDSFYQIAQQRGCCWQDITQCNPGLDPCNLQVGQKITVPVINVQQPASCCTVAAGGGKFNRCDEVVVEVEGVNFKVSRLGEPSIPHELHLILPRTEIRKVQCPASGTLETSIMISNINIVNSPRFEGERIDRAESGRPLRSNSNTNNANSDNQYGYGLDYTQQSYGQQTYGQPTYIYNQQHNR